MTFPVLSDEERLQLLAPPTRKVRAVLDTDTYNEIDDQFAVAHAILSPDKIDLEALYAAPFHNSRSSGPEDGMEKSYEEILRLLEKLGDSSERPVHKGSRGYLSEGTMYQDSPAAKDLVDRALDTAGGPLYVATIGAITNVASAILMEPEIIKNIVIVWLGGHALYWPDTNEFNLQQDVHASRLIFDCGVPVVQIPCKPVTSHLHTTIPEIEAHVNGKSEIGTYLAEIVKGYSDDHFCWSKVIWDIAATSWLIKPSWVTTVLEHSPILTDQVTW
ncbi:MAG: nucleoside hydrolase, partial [Spirochaetales bacterium]|nr:nucleoside hydrolase [Spirochaetales bacterium]